MTQESEMKQATELTRMIEILDQSVASNIEMLEACDFVLANSRDYVDIRKAELLKSALGGRSKARF